MQKWFFLIKTHGRLWTRLVYLNTIEQRPNNIVVIGKHWNSQYCHSRLILEFDFNSIKITKKKNYEMRNRQKVVILIMQWLHNHWIPSCYWREGQSKWNSNQNASMILILLCFTQKTTDFAAFTLEVCRLIRYKEKWDKIEKREKIVFVISRNKRKLPHWFIIQNYWDWFKKIMPL